MNELSAIADYAGSHALAILVALVVSYVVGSVWHGPLFGKLWMEYNGMKQPKKEDMKFSMMIPGLSANLVLMLVLCSVLGYMFKLMNVSTIGGALLITTILWLPFTALAIINNYAWSGKKVGLMLLDSGYYLVSFWVTAAILFWMA